MDSAVDARRAAFRDVLAIPEFRALYVAQTLSVIGDQFARIAIASLVLARTGSALLTGVSYAISYLPWLLGGPVLAIAADRRPRRSVMVACDVLRSGLLAAIGLSNAPTWTLLAVATLVTLFEPPFAAARAALIPVIVSESRYTTAATLGNVSNQLCVVAGFALGGAMTATLGARITVAVDAGTFLLSATVTLRRTQWRPAASPIRRSWPEELRHGAKVVSSDPLLQRLLSMSCMVVCAVIGTEAVALPYAQAHGDGSLCAGVLTATLPAGTTAGSLLLSRASRTTDANSLLPMLALLCPLTLCLTALDPAPTLAGTIWFCAGAFSGITVVANRMFVIRVPDESRGRAFGVAAAGIAITQGVGTLVAGYLAQRLDPALAIAIVSMASVVTTILVTVRSSSQSFLGPLPT